jgi:hypothetical protein
VTAASVESSKKHLLSSLTGCAETAYDVFLGTKEVKAESSMEERHGGVDALTVPSTATLFSRGSRVPAHD